MREEVVRLLRVGRPAVPGREGPRDHASTWCSARISFVMDDPAKPFGLESNSIEVCGRPGRFMIPPSREFPHPIALAQPRAEIRKLLALAGIKELPDCPEPPKPPYGHEYDDFGFACW